uniref:Protocadherin domain-containing protein n=1 Tax=Amphimedon queenslandica TaxID=400682 RepID=A0A1X7T8X5_AMPQE
MITEVVNVPNNLNTFTVNVLLSNNGGTFDNISSFTFGYLGPVTNIDSSIDNCSTIDITWTAPTVDDRVSIQYYILRIYDAITGSLVKNVSVYDTSYQFVDNNLFIHRYTYAITGVNELGEGISNNDTFSYQRVPRSVSRAHFYVTTFNETRANASFSIPVIIECTGESPENATVTIQCNGTGIVFTSTELVEYSQPRNITGSVLVPLYEECNISIVFSNRVGSSELFTLEFDTFLPFDPTPSPTGTDETVTLPPGTPRTTVIIAVIAGCITVILIILIIVTIVLIRVVRKKKKACGKKRANSAPSTSFDQKAPNDYPMT